MISLSLSSENHLRFTENKKRATKLLLQSWIDQREIRFRIKTLLHRYRIDCDHYFQRRGHMRSENMAGLRCSVWIPHHHVGMDYGLSLIERDITTHPNHFVLTIDGNLLVHFAPGIKPSQRRSTQRSNGGEMRTRNVILLRKRQQSGKSLVSLVEDNRILFRPFSRVQLLNLHLGSFAPRNGFRRRYIGVCRILRMRHRGGDPNQYQYATQSFYFLIRVWPSHVRESSQMSLSLSLVA